MPKRTTPYITQFFSRDENAFTALSRVGHVSEKHFKNCGLANGRIKNYCKDGYIEKVCFTNKFKADEAYKLTKIGRELAYNNWDIKNNYHAQSPVHDLQLADKYFSLYDDEKETLKTETEVRGILQDKIDYMEEHGDEEKALLYSAMLDEGLISMPDFVYTTIYGVETAFEVITHNYGAADLEAKEVLVEIMGYQLETVRV